MTPTFRDLAQFFWHALRLGLVSPASVVAWADEIISASDDPPLWAIELSMADPVDVVDVADHLNHVPGVLTNDTVGNLLSALILRRFREGALAWEQAWQLGWELAGSKLLPRSRENMDHLRQRLTEMGLGRYCSSTAEDSDWSEDVSDHWDLYHQGWLTDAQMDERLAAELSRFAAYEQLIPGCVDAGREGAENS